jgi:drug/metabolite transporter (DMT)-like permease
MLWILLALLGAVTNASYFIIIKRYITTLDPKVLTGVGFTCGGLLLLAFSAIRGFPVIGQDFYSAVVITATLNIISLSLIFKALSSSDLSLSIPMLSFTPVILIGTSYLLLHEVPSVSGVAGICIIVIGSYVLNISSADEHILDPVKSMLRNRGSWYMLIVAFLFAVSINFDKIAMLNSDPFFGMALTVLAIGVAFVLMAAYSLISYRNLSSLPEPVDCAYPEPVSRSPAFLQRKYLALAILIGAFVAIEAASINVAYTLQIVPYVIAIKRLSIIFVVLYGTLVFSEDETVKRLMGAALMVTGAIVIVLFA